MNDKQIGTVLLIVAVYYYLHSKGMTAYSQQVTRPTKGSRPNTVASGASTAPRSSRSIPGYASPTSGTGRGVVAAPVRSIGQANSPQASAPGTGIRRAQMSSSWKGFATTGVSPSWPTSQVTSTKTIRISNGRVQVPGYAAIPTTTRGPGGQGSLLNFGGQS